MLVVAKIRDMRVLFYSVLQCLATTMYFITNDHINKIIMSFDQMIDFRVYMYKKTYIHKNQFLKSTL